MSGEVINLFIIMAGGVILATLIAGGSTGGTKALFDGITSFWNTGVKGMLGIPS